MQTPFESTDPMYSTGYCRHFNVETINILRGDSDGFHYFFNHKTGKLEGLECEKCQPEVTEKDLYPIDAEYSEDLKNHVIFMLNQITAKVEQYIFINNSWEFEQVDHPEIVLRDDSITTDIVCAIKDADEMVLIQRNEKKTVKKMYYDKDTHGFSKIPAGPVETLLMKKSFSGEIKMDPENQMEIQQDEFCERLHSFCLQNCPTIQKTVFCVLLRDGTYSRFILNEEEEFEGHNCKECTGVTEKRLSPLYSEFCEYLNDHVLFVKNLSNFRVEQYVFCKENLDLEQIFNPDIKFYHEKVTTEELVMSIDYCGRTIEFLRADDGSVQKRLKTKMGDIVEIEEEPVRTFDVKRQEADEKEDIETPESDDSCEESDEQSDSESDFSIISDEYANLEADFDNLNVLDS